MADSNIEWTDASWNPVRGCERVSDGCKRCYAERVAWRFGKKPGMPYFGLVEMTSQGPKWTGVVREQSELLDQPIRWRKPKRIFVNSMSDLFHEDLDDIFIDRVFASMALSPQHTFQILTKRPRRMLDYVGAGGRAAGVFDYARNSELGYWAGADQLAPLSWPLPNVWLGVSAENQRTFDQRVELLGQVPAAVRWVSAEPLLGGIDTGNAFDDDPSDKYGRIDWLVAGGESGPNPRPSEIDWFRALALQCRLASVPFFMKQITTPSGRKIPFESFPPELQVREYPG